MINNLRAMISGKMLYNVRDPPERGGRFTENPRERNIVANRS